MVGFLVFCIVLFCYRLKVCNQPQYSLKSKPSPEQGSKSPQFQEMRIERDEEVAEKIFKRVEINL